MKREKEVPAGLIRYIKEARHEMEVEFEQPNLFCTVPVRMARMRIVTDADYKEEFRNVIVPAVDVYVTGKTARLREGYINRDAMSYFVAGTRKSFPFGHVYNGSGKLCLGTVFVPSAISERSVTLPLETLFLHNDRNLSHGGSSLYLSETEIEEIHTLLDSYGIKLSYLAQSIQKGVNVIAKDEIWNMSVDVAKQMALPRALEVMEQVYAVIFKPVSQISNDEKEVET